MAKQTIRISFKRLARIAEEGKADIVVNDPTDAEEIEQALSQHNFKGFIVNSREYLDTEWQWEKE